MSGLNSMLSRIEHEKSFITSRPGLRQKVQVGMYSKTCVKWLLSKRQNKDLNDKWLLNEGQMYCRMLQREHSAIL